MNRGMTDDEKQAAVDALRFLQDPTTPRVLERVIRFFRDLHENSEPADAELRDHCYLQLKAVREFHRQLTRMAETGKLEGMRRARNDGGADSAA